MNLFAYGTLMWPEVFEAVTGRALVGTPSVLRGFLRMRVKNESYPVLIASQPQDVVEGILYRDLTEVEFRCLDRFEGEEYERREVCIDAVPAQVYALSPAWRHIVSAQPWTPDQMHMEQLAAFCAECKAERDA